MSCVVLVLTWSSCQTALLDSTRIIHGLVRISFLSPLLQYVIPATFGTFLP